MIVAWASLLAVGAEDGEETETDKASHMADAHRAVGFKLIDLTAFGDEQTSTWLGAGIIVERPVHPKAVLEVAVQGLFGTPAKPGFALPVDLLLKRVWSVGARTVITAGGGPSLTYMRIEGEDEVFPGVLGSLGGSYWLGKDTKWGILAEVDGGGSFETEGFVPELELAVGAVWKL